MFYVLQHLYSQGIGSVVFCTRRLDTHYWKQHEKHFSGDIWYSADQEPLGTGGALRNALPLLDSDPILVLNGDTFCKFDLSTLLEWKDLTQFKNIIMQRFEDSVNMGVYLLSKDFIESMPEGTSSLEECLDAYGKKDPVSGVANLMSDRPFHDIGTPEGYAGAEAFLRQQGVIT